MITENGPNLSSILFLQLFLFSRTVHKRKLLIFKYRWKWSLKVQSDIEQSNHSSSVEAILYEKPTLFFQVSTSPQLALFYKEQINVSKTHGGLRKRRGLAYHSKLGKFNIGHMSEDGIAFQQNTLRTVTKKRIGPFWKAVFNQHRAQINFRTQNSIPFN